MLIAFMFSLLGRSAWTACVCGVTALAGLEIGYVAMAGMRGYPSASTTVAFWLTTALAFGPLTGLAAYYLSIGARPWGALGGGLIAGIVTGEGLAGYARVRDTTTPGYWIVEMIYGLILLALGCRRTRSGWPVVAFFIAVAGLLATTAVSVFGA